jgi:hypothetical protein
MVDRGPTRIPASKHPLPVEAKGFRFLASPSLPTMVILEVDTEKNPVRIGFYKDQLARLSELAAVSAAKIW